MNLALIEKLMLVAIGVALGLLLNVGTRANDRAELELPEASRNVTQVGNGWVAFELYGHWFAAHARHGVMPFN